MTEEQQKENLLKTQRIPKHCNHNAHIYYVLLDKRFNRNQVIETMLENSVKCTFHYIPLHNSPAIDLLDLPKTYTNLEITEDISERLIRLPLWVGLNSKVNEISEVFYNAISDQLN